MSEFFLFASMFVVLLITFGAAGIGLMILPRAFSGSLFEKISITFFLTLILAAWGYMTNFHQFGFSSNPDVLEGLVMVCAIPLLGMQLSAAISALASLIYKGLERLHLVHSKPMIVPAIKPRG